MTSHLKSIRGWRTLALTGTALTFLGIAAGYFDTDFIARYFGVFVCIGLAGVSLAIIGCIGWGKHVDKRKCNLLALSVLTFPWVLLVGGYPIGKTYAHGPAPPIVLIAPATVLALTLLIMAAMKR